MNWDVLKPGYTVQLNTPAQHRLYTKVLLAKIFVQVVLICLLLALGGWSWLQLGCIVAIATVWQGSNYIPAVHARPVLKTLVGVVSVGLFLLVAWCL